MPKFHKVQRSLQALRTGFTRDNPNRFNDNQLQLLGNWVRGRVAKALEFSSRAYPQDAFAMIEITEEYDDKMFENL